MKPSKMGRAVIFDDNQEIRLRLNTLAREQMKERLLQDILFDMEVCRLEGWDVKSYLLELRKLITDIIQRKIGNGNK